LGGIEIPIGERHEDGGDDLSRMRAGVIRFSHQMDLLERETAGETPDPGELRSERQPSRFTQKEEHPHFYYILSPDGGITYRPTSMGRGREESKNQEVFCKITRLKG
jgi:hypothetical protein